MSVYQHLPAQPLRQHVEWLWFYDDFFPDHDREHVLPDGTFELMINLEDRPRKLFERQDLSRHRSFRRGWVSGTHAEYLVIDALPGSSMIGAHFRPGGAVAVLGMPAGELCDQVVELDAVWGADVWQWRDRLLEALTPQRKFQVFEQLLLQKLRAAPIRGRRQAAVSWALERFMHEPQVQKIRTVSDALGLSQKHFIEIFRREVGLTPKRFCRIRRFQEVLGRIKSDRRVDWADVVCGCGYFDQAHFINEFTAFSGLSPSVYLRQRLDGDPKFARAPG
jgi:AraC-like DNA-binding protein